MNAKAAMEAFNASVRAGCEANPQEHRACDACGEPWCLYWIEEMTDGDEHGPWVGPCCRPKLFFGRGGAS